MKTDISTAERIRCIVADINEAEARLASANALATDELRALLPTEALAQLESSYDRAFKSVTTLHSRLDKAMKAVPQLRSGGGK